MTLPEQFADLPPHIGYYILGILVIQVVLAIKIFADGVDQSGATLLGLPAIAKIAAAILIAAGALSAVGLTYVGAFHYRPGSFPPPLAFSLSAPVVVGILFYGIPGMRRVVLALDPVWLVGIQVIRAFGMIFPILYDMGLLPRAFALGAGYGDIAVGVTAPVAAWLYATRNRWAAPVAVVFSVVGILDIFTLAISTYVVTLPGLFPSVDTTVSSDLMNYFPMAVIPGFIAPFFVLLHIYTLFIIWNREPGRASGRPFRVSSAR